MASRLLQSSVASVEPANPGADSLQGTTSPSERTMVQPTPTTNAEVPRQKLDSGASPSSPASLPLNTDRLPPAANYSTPQAPKAPEPEAAPPSAYSGYRDAQLDPPPRPIDVPDPIYPEEAGQREGVVVLRLYIGADGKVDRAVVVRAVPPGLFERSALTAFAQARFTPGYYLGVPVPSQITIELNYTPTNRGGNVSGQGAVR